MSAKLSTKLRKALLNELQAHERYVIAFSMKAIQRRHGVSRQTLSRLRAELLREGVRGKAPLEAKGRTATADAKVRSGSNRVMTNEEMIDKLVELERRADMRDRGSVEIGETLIALLDAAAARQNTTRDHLAAAAVHRWLMQNADLRLADSHTH